MMKKMEIYGYDEVDWQQVLELNLIGFNWYLTPDLVKTILDTDKRIPKYYAIYGVEKGEVLGQVGIFIDETKTINGVEKIGYLWTVCTKPTAFMKGIATNLIKEAHNRLLSNGVRYSFLGTERSLIAYNLFRKLGYSDFIDSNMCFKTYSKNDNDEIETYISTEFNEKEIFKIFSDYSQNSDGFVLRPKNFISIRKAWGWIPLDLIGVFKKNNESIGYFLGSKEEKIINIRELCCPVYENIPGCIKALEVELNPEHMIFHFISKRNIINILKNNGFSHINKTLPVYMIKDLKEEQAIEEIQKLYGIKENKFQMTTIDYY